MKVTIDSERCRGHGVCCAICPQMFTLNDEGYAEPLHSEIPTDMEYSVREAVDSCPEGAIATT